MQVTHITQMFNGILLTLTLTLNKDEDVTLRLSCLLDTTRPHTALKPRPVHCCVSVQGLHPLKDSAFVVFEGESFRETLLTSSAVVKWDGLAFGAFPGCVAKCFTLTSRFLTPRPAKVTIYTNRCTHFLSFFLLFQEHKEYWDM